MAKQKKKKKKKTRRKGQTRYQKGIKMGAGRRNPKGQRQSSTMVIIPAPAKKTNVKRRGKRR